MRLIAHLSDLHFGTVHLPTLAPLRVALHAIQPHVVAISGDLTQRARVSQFREAREFLDSLPRPQIVVPGNHDVPLYNVFARFAEPLSRYQRYITGDLSPSFIDDEIAVMGVNTARSLTFKGGRVSQRQATRACTAFDGLSGAQTRIVVTHHPFDVPADGDEDDLVGRSRMAMQAFAKCGVDLFLSGHLHRTHHGSTSTRYKIPGHSALVIHAGTATSTRGRGEENSFNLIRIDRPRISVETHVWQPSALNFALTRSLEFRHAEKGWVTTEG